MKLRVPKADILLLLAPLFCFGFAWLNSNLEFAQHLEWRSLDWRTQYRASHRQPPPDERILVVGIGENTTINIAPWPFSRAYHGELQYLARHDPPKVWVWDVIFQNRVNRDGDPIDAEADLTFSVRSEDLAKVNIPVVTAAVSSRREALIDPNDLGLTRPFTRVVGDISLLEGDTSATLPYPGLRHFSYFGFADAPRGATGIVRQIPLVLKVADMVLPSLSLQVVMRYYGISPEEVHIVLGDAIDLGPKAEHRFIPIDEHGRMFINYRYEKTDSVADLGRQFPVVEYFYQLVALDEFYERGEKGIQPPAAMKDRIVFVGEFATDAGTTPLAKESPLVLLQANVTNNILRGDHVQVLPERWVWLGGLLISYAGIGLFRERSVLGLVLFTLLVVAGFIWATFFYWGLDNLWIPLMAPLAGFLMMQFGFIVYRVLTEQSAKLQMRAMFGSYLSPVVINQMVDSGQSPELGGIEAEITAYFSDIQSFSSFSEVLEPSQLVALLNEYLTACTDIVQEQGGTLDKYIGDAVVAMFGAPVPLPDHAFKACLTSLLVQRKIDELRVRWTEAGAEWPQMVKEMRTRIGLNTGSCMIGNMGSRTRFDYTMMGDNVNLAARMESGAKTWGVFNMVTEETRRACETHGGDRIVFRTLGRIRVKGRSAPVPVHEVVALREDVDETTRQCIQDFESALAAYYDQNWDAAEAALERSAARERFQPGRDFGVSTNPSLKYLQIIAELRQSPPGSHWDGVYVMGAK